MANYEVTRRILVRKLGIKAGKLTEALVSGPCKTRTPEEQSGTLATLAESLAGTAARLEKLDKANPPAVE